MVQPYFAGVSKAAKLFDMTKSEFLQLVNDGVLPRPLLLGELERWDVAQLRAFANGEAADAAGHIEW